MTKKSEICDSDCMCGCNEDNDCTCNEITNEDVVEIIHEDKVQELEEKIIRIQAEFQNYKRRTEEEIMTIFKYSNQDIALSLLPVIDNIERALDIKVSDEVSKFLEGIKMIEKELKEILKTYEINEIDSLNKEFNPNYHQAVITEKKKGVKQGVVIEVLQKGYMLKDRVIRYASVKVSE